MPSLSTDLVRQSLPYKEITIIPERRHCSQIIDLPTGNLGLVLKNHFDELMAKGVKLQDVHVSNIFLIDTKYSIEYDLVKQIIETENDICIKPFTPGRRVASIWKDGTVDFVDKPTIEELTETIKVLTSIEAIRILASRFVKIDKPKQADWDTVKKEFNINDKPKVFPNDGFASEIISHRVNGFNKNIKVFALTNQPPSNLKVPFSDRNDYMILLPFECKKKDAQKIVFEKSDGSWNISDNKKIQVIWRSNGLVGIVTTTNPDNGGVSLSFYKVIYLSFQNGAVKDNGINGITNEIMMAILIDRFMKNNNGLDDRVIIDSLQTARLWMHKKVLDKRIHDEYYNENPVLDG